MFEGLTTGGILGLFVVVSVVLVRSQRSESVSAEQYRTQLDQQGRTISQQGATILAQGAQIAELTKSNWLCELRMSMALAAMHRAGIEIPKELRDGTTHES